MDKLEVGQQIKYGGGTGLIRAISKDRIVLERLNFQLFGKTEYIVGCYYGTVPAKLGELVYVDWCRGDYFYKLEDALIRAGLYLKDPLPKEGIKLQGYIGKWKVKEEGYWRAYQIILLEREDIQSDRCLIVNKCYDVLLSGVTKGLDEYRSLKDGNGWL